MQELDVVLGPVVGTKPRKKKEYTYCIEFIGGSGETNSIREFRAFELRYSDYWLVLRDENGRNLHVFNAEYVKEVSEVEDGSDTVTS